MPSIAEMEAMHAIKVLANNVGNISKTLTSIDNSLKVIAELMKEKSEN